MTTKDFYQRHLIAAFLIILATSIVFGVWFKTQQLSIASPELLNFYPWSGFALSVVQTLVLFATLALGLALVGSWVDYNQTLTSKNFFHCTLPFFAFSLSVFGLGLFYQFILFVVGVGCYLLLKIKENWFLFSLRTKEPILVLLLFFILFSWIYETVSPFYDRSFLSLPGRLDMFTNLEHQWENAKAYDFLGNFSQSYRLGGYSQGNFMVSPLLSLVALILDTPITDVYAKYDLVKWCLFFLYLFSSFGCYLFLRFGLRLSFVPSVLGGFAYILTNSAFLSYLGNEYPINIVPFTFLPWAMLCVSLAYAKGRLEWIFLAGLVASLSQHVWLVNLECTALLLSFLVIYICWMATGKLFYQGFHWSNIKRLVLEVVTFPVAVFIGMAYYFVPFIEAIASMEYLVIDNSSTMGFWWGGALEHYASIFFRFEDANLYSFAPGLYSPLGGPVIGFYTGQFSLFMIFFLLCRTLIFLYQKYLSKESSEGSKIRSSESFFLAGLIFCLITFPMGDQGWFSKFMEFTGVLRVHNYLRVSMYFFFFALVAAMLGLHYLLKLKSIKTLFIVTGAYLLLLIGVYFSPLFPKSIPDKILMDVGFFVATLSLFSLLFWCTGRIKNKSYAMGSPFFPLINSEKLVLGLIIILGALSCYTLYPSARDYLTKGTVILLDKSRNFYSFRSAVVVLRGNRHDVASYNYLDKRVEDFERLFESERHHKMNFLNAHYWEVAPSNLKDKKLGTKAIREYKKNEQSILKLLRQRHGPVKEFKKYLNDQRRKEKISQGTYEQAFKYLSLGDQKLAFFEVAAPTIDNFYLQDGNTFTIATIALAPHRVAPIQHLAHSSYQYYLPDEYSFFVLSNLIQGEILVLPLGKNHELYGPSLWGAGESYPSKDINFYLRSLYLHAYDNEELLAQINSEIHPNMRGHFNLMFLQGKLLNFFRPNPFIRKLLDVSGADHVTLPRIYLGAQMEAEEKAKVLEDLRSQGFIEFKFPQSYHASSKFPKIRQMRVFTNPQSYGRAYVAKWVKMIRTEDNLANQGILSFGKFWPRSKVLTKNFEKHMSSIPKDIWRSIIIESSSLKDKQESPQVFEGDNRVDIKKIIASKAVFEVDCQDEHCWFVYNTTILNGWKAYSGSEELPVNKANLGFIGLKLEKGKQLVWLEYAPPSLVIGFLVTLSGWFLLFCFFLKQGGLHKKTA
ncbi:MAG: YfhO family protein [Nitrospina sp.]|nr:YfhO family protein [Nitrospina sp.]